MLYRSASLVAAVTAVVGLAAAGCSSAATGARTGAAAAATSAVAVSSTPAAAQGPLKALTAAQLLTTLVQPADVPDLGLAVDTASNPRNLRSGSGTITGEDFPGTGGAQIFGAVDGADTQPCALLLNALGYGKNAPIATSWAQVEYAPLRSSEIIVSENVARYPAGKAAGVVSAVASPGSGCKTVTTERAMAQESDTVQPLTVDPVGDAVAGTHTVIPVRSGFVDYFAVEARVGDYVITVSGSQTNRNGAVVLDQKLIGELLAHAAAKLSAAAA